MKTPMEIFKKHGAHYYENDEQAIIDAMTEYAEQQVKNCVIPDVSHSCICCGKEIKKLDGLPKDKDWECMWDGGIVGRISAGYGSLLDGDMYVLAICDDCVKLKELKYVGNYMFPAELNSKNFKLQKI